MKSRAAGAIAFSILTSFIAAGFAPALAEYPEQNVTIIVPFPAGGASDIAGRVTGNKLSERLGKSVLIENRAGANGSLGATAMKAAKPDG
ncbi:MAG: tripartite tricarboxylate transporter substrate-binding protein [Hyphomicrobiales bacterium]|nr:tripartite tricarboxylate transporter substrate-binding protein [Hyphomicrobiales bacterium]